MLISHVMPFSSAYLRHMLLLSTFISQTCCSFQQLIYQTYYSSRYFISRTCCAYLTHVAIIFSLSQTYVAALTSWNYLTCKYVLQLSTAYLTHMLHHVLVQCRLTQLNPQTYSILSSGSLSFFRSLRDYYNLYLKHYFRLHAEYVHLIQVHTENPTHYWLLVPPR